MNEVIPFKDLQAMAAVMSKTRMFGKNSDELLALMLIAQAEGKHPAIAAQEYDVIQGKPAINSRSALARFQVSGGSIRWIKRTDTEASAEFAHPQGGKLIISWTIDRAAKAGIAGKDNWKKYPAQMLAARVIAEGVRAVFPACLSGLYTVEEVQDFPKDITPTNITPAEEIKETEEEPKVTTKKDPEREALISKIAEAVKAASLTEKQKEFYRQEIKITKTEELQSLLDEIKKHPGESQVARESLNEGLENGFIGAEVKQPEHKPELEIF